MRIFRVVVVLFLIFCLANSVYAQEKKLATPESLALLKSDFLSGNLKIGVTRLKQIKDTYGDPNNAVDSVKTVVYDYGDLKLEFERYKYFREWKYDYSHKTAYSKDINSLRTDLEGGQILPGYKTLEEIIKDYKKPTEGFDKPDDGDMPVFYWGELRLTFENVIVLKKWTAKNLENKTAAEEVLKSKQ